MALSNQVKEKGSNNEIEHSYDSLIQEIDGDFKDVDPFEDKGEEEGQDAFVRSDVTLEEIKSLKEMIRKEDGLKNLKGQDRDLIGILQLAEHNESFKDKVHQAKALELYQEVEELVKGGAKNLPLDGESSPSDIESYLSTDEEEDEGEESDDDQLSRVVGGTKTYFQKSGVVEISASFGEIKSHEITGPVQVKISVNPKDIPNTKVEIEKDVPREEMRTIKIHRLDDQGNVETTETVVLHDKVTQSTIDGPLPDEEGKVTYNGEPYSTGVDSKITFFDEVKKAPIKYDLKKVIDGIEGVTWGSAGGQAASALFTAVDQAFKTGDWDSAISASNAGDKGNDMVAALVFGLIYAYNKKKAVQIIESTPIAFRKALVQSAMSDPTTFNDGLYTQGILNDKHYDYGKARDINTQFQYDPATGRGRIVQWETLSGSGTKANPNFWGPLGDLSTTADMVRLINSTIPAKRTLDPEKEMPEDSPALEEVEKPEKEEQAKK